MYHPKLKKKADRVRNSLKLIKAISVEEMAFYVNLELFFHYLEINCLLQGVPKVRWLGFGQNSALFS